MQPALEVDMRHKVDPSLGGPFAAAELTRAPEGLIGLKGGPKTRYERPEIPAGKAACWLF